MNHPFCSKGDLAQGKKWVWQSDRDAGGEFLCWDHFNAALRDGTVTYDGKYYNYVEE